MDQFFKILIREKNPEARGLADILEEREIAFSEKMKDVTVPWAISDWAKKMEGKRGKRGAHLADNIVVVGHLPCDYITALMVVRYGQNPDFWPPVFSPEDYERALGWEQGSIPGPVLKYEYYIPPIAGGQELTDYMEAQIGNGLFRTGLTTTTAWAASAVKSVGDIVRAVTWNDTLFECVVAGTTAATEPTWGTTIGTETVDNTVTWKAAKIGVVKRSHYMALFTAAPGETGGGTEVTGGSYARVELAPTDANWTANAQVAGAGRNDNAVDITYPAPTANWGSVTDTADMSRVTGGNMHIFTPLTTAKTVNNGDPAPKFAIGAFDMDWS